MAVVAYSGVAYIFNRRVNLAMFLFLIRMLVAIIIFNFRFYWLINVGDVVAYS